MIKYCLDKWNKNHKILEEVIRNKNGEMNSVRYRDLVEMVVEHIFNEGDNDEYELYNNWDVDNIVEIDNGDYKGTLLYVIPLNTYQPSEYEYLMTYVGYGSCSGCDTLQAIQDWEDNKSLTDEQINDFMTLCKDIVTNTIRPFNHGWRNNEWFDIVEMQ